MFCLRKLIFLEGDPKHICNIFVLGRKGPASGLGRAMLFVPEFILPALWWAQSGWKARAEARSGHAWGETSASLQLVGSTATSSAWGPVPTLVSTPPPSSSGWVPFPSELQNQTSKGICSFPPLGLCASCAPTRLQALSSPPRPFPFLTGNWGACAAADIHAHQAYTQELVLSCYHGGTFLILWVGRT